jgi:predicted acylesterase/phospholipase RssA
VSREEHMESALRCKYGIIAGGGTKALAYLGIMKALEQNIGQAWADHYSNNMRGFVGASAGSIVALCMTLQLSANDVREVVQPFLENIRRIVPHPDISKLLNNYGMDSGDGIQQLVKDVLRRGGLAEDTTLERIFALTRREFSCTGLNLNTNTVHMFDRQGYPDMMVVDAVRISTSVPLLYTPVSYRGDLYVDGALGCNMPDRYPREDCMLWCLCVPQRFEVTGWADYFHTVMQVSMVAQRPTEDALRAECAFVVHVRMPDAILNAPGVNLNQTITTTETLISCGYAACCDALSRGGLYEALAAVTVAVVPRQNASSSGASNSATTSVPHIRSPKI